MLVSEIVALAIHCRLAVRDFPNDPSIIEIGELQAGFLQLLCGLILKRFKHLCFWLDLHIHHRRHANRLWRREEHVREELR